MPFNALAIAKITKESREGRINDWIRLQKEIEQQAYHGYDYFTLPPHKWRYIDELREYGFEVISDESHCSYIVRWDNV